MRTVATSPRRTRPPAGVSISMSWMLVRLWRTLGSPQTTTSNTFCSSNRLPTVIPDSRVAAARRTSPGLILWRWAAARLVSISTVGSVDWAFTCGATTPRTPAMALATSCALAWSTCRFSP